MKCPNCKKDIKDSAKFCGYCGKEILKKASLKKPLPPEMIESQINTIPEDLSNSIAKKIQNPKKILLILILISFTSGSVMGFLVTRNIVSFDLPFFSRNSFKWTSFSEGENENAYKDNTSLEETEKGEESSQIESPTEKVEEAEQ